MKFSEYLLLEKVSKREFNDILLDKNFRLGFEFEYFDHNLHNDNIMHNVEDMNFDDALSKQFHEFVDYVNELRDYIDIQKYFDEYEMDEEEKKLPKSKRALTEYKKSVKTYNEKNGTNHKPFSSDIDKKFNTQLNDLKNSHDQVKDKSHDTQLKLARERDDFRVKFLKPYGLENFRDPNSESAKLLKLYQDYGKKLDKIKKSPSMSFKDYLLRDELLPDIKREKLDELEEFVHVIEYYHKNTTRSYDKVSDIIDNLVNTAYDSIIRDVGYLSILSDELRDPFDENMYQHNEDEAADFKNIVKHSFNFEDFPFDNYVIDSDSNSNWSIIPDGSLDYNEGGVEVTSPIMNLKEGLDSMDKMLQFIKGNGHTSDIDGEETGLHINISYKGFNLSNLDIFKSMLFMEEEGWIEKNFPNRYKNEWTQSITAAIKYRQSGKEVHDISKLINKNMFKNRFEIAYHFIPDNQKHMGINRINAEGDKGRVEFRYMGGEDYEYKGKQIKQNIIRFCYLLKLGIDENYKKKEYLQKLNKLLTTDELLPSDKIADKVGSEYSYYKIDKNTVGEYKFSKKGKAELIQKIPMTRYKKLIEKNPEKYTEV